MRKLLSYVAAFLFSLPAAAGTLSTQDVAKLESDITAMYAAFEKGDPALIVAGTHESVYPLVGGQETFEKASREAIEQLLQKNVKFLESEIGVPTQTYSAGDDEICFVPRTSIMEIQGMRVRSIGFMIAIRSASTKTWKYLDGSMLTDLQFLKELFPKLQDGVELPPNSVELL